MAAMKLIKLLTGSLVFIFVIGLGACVYDPSYRGPPTRTHTPYFYDYYYYPNVDVYFDLSLGYYYYRSSKHWARVRVLPKHFYLDHRYRKSLHMEHKTPYVKHPEHRKKYHSRDEYRNEKGEVRRDRDRKEREYNSRQHKQYQKRPERERSRQ